MTLISPGISITLTDDSFFIPSSGGSVALFIIATGAEKTQPNGSPAVGTFESGVVRTVTSVAQSVELYGIPKFQEDSNGNQLHGDARQEYGLFALNSYLGVANKAYVLRADVNLNDNRDDILALWQSKFSQTTVPVGSAYVLEGLVSQFISDFNLSNGYIPGDLLYKVTVTKNEMLSLLEDALESVLGEETVGSDVFFGESTFRNIRDEFMDDQSLAPFNIFPNGFDQAPAATDTFGLGTGYLGVQGMADAWELDATLGNVVGFEEQFSPSDARDFLIAASEDFQYTLPFLNGTTLGANDAAKRVAISQALASAINSNEEIRSEAIEYDIVGCPGYPEVGDELVALSQTLFEEVFVVGSTPMNMTPTEVVAWGDGNVLPWPRQRSQNIAYYYPHGLASNLDGKNVFVDSAGIAMRQIAVSDTVASRYLAPAGTRRGLISGVAALGHVSGTLGTPTTFNQIRLNQGQTDDLYKYTTNINPLVEKPGRGLLVWGQKNSAPAASSLDRIAVMRTIMYIRRQLRKNLLPFLFQPNNDQTRTNIKAIADGFLGDLVLNDALADFATICDASNNTDDRIQRSELYLDVILKPQIAAEFIFVPIRVVSQSEDI